MDTAEKKPWEMTPEAFGKSFAPIRTATHPPGFYYPFAGGIPHPTREAAVRSGHRHIVARAIEAGQAVPDNIRDLYPDLAKSDFAELAGVSTNEASTIGILATAINDIRSSQAEMEARNRMALAKSQQVAQDALAKLVADAALERKESNERAARTQATLAKCLAEAEQERDRIIGAVLLAHEDAQSLNDHTTMALAKALAAVEKQGEAAFIQASEFRGELDRVYVALQKTLEAFSAIAKTQADAMREQEPPKPKKWTFKVRRDASGNIESIDADQG